MTIRFAAPPGAIKARMSPEATMGAVRWAANDNGSLDDDDASLHAALRYFSEHGLAAAYRARKEAETAFFNGDRGKYRWWLQICRVLDRRLARELVTRTGSTA